MKQSALGSVFFFQRMVIGLDNYKGKESLSRVVETLKLFHLVRLIEVDLMLKFLMQDLLEIHQ